MGIGHDVSAKMLINLVLILVGPEGLLVTYSCMITFLVLCVWVTDK